MSHGKRPLWKPSAIGEYHVFGQHAIYLTTPWIAPPRGSSDAHAIARGYNDCDNLPAIATAAQLPQQNIRSPVLFVKSRGKSTQPTDFHIDSRDRCPTPPGKSAIRLN